MIPQKISYKFSNKILIKHETFFQMVVIKFDEHMSKTSINVPFKLYNLPSIQN